MTNEMMDLRSGIRHAKLIAAWRRKSHPAKVPSGQGHSGEAGASLAGVAVAGG